MGSNVFVNAGIKEVYFAAKGAFPARDSDGSYTGVYGLGVRQNGSLVGNHFQEIRDNKNRVFPNLFNFKVDMPTMQIDNPSLIGALISCAKGGGASVAVVTAGVTKSESPYVVESADGGIFIFDTDGTADNNLGIDFELKFGLKERLCNITFERAFKYGTTANSGKDSHYEVIEAAATNTLKWVTDTLPNVIVGNVVDGFVSPSYVPAGSLTNLVSAFSDINLVDFNASIKTKSTKNGFNSSMVSGLSVELMGQAMGADVSSILDALEYEMLTGSPIAITLGTTTINLYKNNITRIGDFEISDDNRNVKFTYTGEYDLEYVNVSGNNINMYSSLEV